MNQMGPDSHSRIQVCSCENFSIVKGETSSKDVLKLNEVLDKFYEKYENLEKKIKNIIDLIEYDKEIKTFASQEFIFSNSKNSKKILLDDNLYFSRSYFPYGFSLNENRSLYYYFKNIVYNIPPTYPFTEIRFQVVLNDNVVDFEIQDDYLSNEDNCLKSPILDAYDFNYKSLETELKGSDLTLELLEEDFEIDAIRRTNPNFIFI